jgi:hypothetical protein
LIAHKIHSGVRGQGMVSSLVFAPNQAIELVDPSYVTSMLNKSSQQSEYFLGDPGSSATTASRLS